ncbi:hypothetical protein GCM10022403_012120 [Streptomyces coacervatus]|uniref:Secreted protein n=1 Tax=Streptomyces coacervatus TaxID=647381 RepID=A0ABP7GYG9_9ACTN|nr:hypothetical protein [Streptomyces coacervatus]MDF2272160.1 hypothetical protein [Streptomyces coacervatus]
MAVSLGMRVSGLLVVGAVAVAFTAFGGDGSGTQGRGGGEGTIVTAGPSDSPGAHASPASPTPRTSPAGAARGTVGPSSPRHSRSTAAPSPSTSSAPSPGNRPLLSPSWLPPGPVSPNADAVPDPSSVYDKLRDPAQCQAALKVIPPVSGDPEWRLLRALAGACLAVQGRGGNWGTAAREYSALAGKADTCKGRAAYAVLGGLLDYHRQHPGATVQLKAASGGTPACAYRIAGVDRSEAQPGDTVGIELRGTYFDHAELLRFGSVFIGGRQTAGPPVLRSQTGDRLVLSVVVPPLDGLSDVLCGATAPQRGAGNCATSHNEPAADPRPITAPRTDRTVDVVVRYGNTEARLKNAFTVTVPTAVPSPEAPSGTPQGMLPLGPLTAHLPGP